MKNIRKQVDILVGKVLVVIFTAMVINVLWQVFTRFFTTSPSAFTDELARYLMIWLGILGGAYVAGRNEHVAIDVFKKKFNPIIQQRLNVLITLLILGFALFALVIGGGRLVFITYTLQQFSPALKIPLAAVYAVVPLSGLLIIFYKLTAKNLSLWN